MNKKVNRFKRFRHKLTIQQDSETIEISTEIKRNKNNPEEDNKSDEFSLDYLNETHDRVKSSIVYDSMKTYLNNITNVAVNSVYPNYDSEQDDDTSIRETITIHDQNKEEESPACEENGNRKEEGRQNYEIHQINSDERVEEVDDFRRFKSREKSKYANNTSPVNLVQNDPIEGSSIAILVEKLPEIKDFDETVAIVDSVVIDHVSEDEKSTSSEEVTYERWTEETKIFATKVFDKNGELVDEIIEQTSPELIGNVLREKLIERHEHITHKSQDVKKLVKVKSPGQSKRQSLDINEIMQETVSGSSVIIVEPTGSNRNTLSSTTTKLDNTYFIQHQQIIKPSTDPAANEQLKLTGRHSYASLTLPLSTSNLADNSTNAVSSSLMHNITTELVSFNNNNNNTDLSKLNAKKTLNNTENKNISFYLNKANEKNDDDDALFKIINQEEKISKSNNDCLFGASSSSSSFSSTSSSYLSQNNTFLVSVSNQITDVNVKNSNLNSTNNKFDYSEDSSNQCTVIFKSNHLINASLNNYASSFDNATDLNAFYINQNYSNNDFNNHLSFKDDYKDNEKTCNDVTTKSKLRLKNNLENLTTFDSERNNEPTIATSFELPKKTQSNYVSNISTYYGSLEARSILTNENQPENVMIINKNDPDQDSLNEFNIKSPKKINKFIDIRSNSPTHDVEKRNELVRLQFEKITSVPLLTDYHETSMDNQPRINETFDLKEDENDISKSKNSSETSDSLESMEKFERPSKLEMKLKQDSKVKINFENDEKENNNNNVVEDSLAGSTISNSSELNKEEANATRDDLNFSISFEQKLINFKLEMQQNQSQIDKLNQDLLNSKVDLTKLTLKDEDDLSQRSIQTDSISNDNQHENKMVHSSPNNQNTGGKKNEDMTDVSDDEHNIFNSNLETKLETIARIDSHEEAITKQASPSTRKAFPLRRESFEMAQKQDTNTKRLSISALAAAVSSSSQSSNNQKTLSSASSASSASTSSSSTSSLAFGQKASFNTKRLLSEIKPAATSIPISTNYDSNPNDKEKYLMSITNQEKLMCLEEEYKLNLNISNKDNSNNKKDFDDSIENDSVCSDSSTNILERNYEIIKRKTTEKINRTQSNASSNNDQIVADKTDVDYDAMNNTTSIYENLNNNEQLLPSQPSFVSSHSIKSLNRSTQDEMSSSSYSTTPVKNLNKTSRIKIVKKQKPSQQQQQQQQQAAAANRFRSISPSALKRGPDIIETIETTTSMSFIMNKKINLVMEEKRQPPNAKNSTDPSQPQLMHQAIKMNNDFTDFTDTSPQDFLINSKSTAIPITVQVRSKSEPKAVPLHESNNQIIKTSSPNNHRITFHKYDSNEIIAVVNVPEATREQTVHAINNNDNDVYSSNNFNYHCNRPTSDFIYATHDIKIDNDDHQQTSSIHKPKHVYKVNNYLIPNHSASSFSTSHHFSKSEPNLNETSSNQISRFEEELAQMKKIDSWKNWPDYAVEQDTDSSVVSSTYEKNISNTNNYLNENWIKYNEQNEMAQINFRGGIGGVQKAKINTPNVEFEIEIEKRPSTRQNYESTTSVSVDGQPVKARVVANRDGGISIENVSFVPGNEIIIQSDINFDNHNIKKNNRRLIDNRKNWSTDGRYSTNSVNNTMTVVDQETIAATRMSSGYFSGDEFKSYYNNYEINCSNFLDQNNSYINQNNTNNSGSSFDSSIQFNINKFLNNKKNKYKKDAIDELNKLYNSLGLEEDDAIFETANAPHDRQLYGGVYTNSNIFNNNATSTSSNNQYRRIPITTLSKNDPRYRRSHSISNRLDDFSFTALDENNDFNNSNYMRSNAYQRRAPDTIKDDMAARRTRLMSANTSNSNSSQIERESSSLNHSSLNKSSNNYFDSSSILSNSNNYQSSSNLIGQPLHQFDNDQTSFLNNRKRSNSCTSLNNNFNSSCNNESNPLLILPSPTCADYLRNKTRENALINVVMNPIKGSTDYEMSQILYDDMAYRQLRKDSEACKLSQIKTAATITTTTSTPSYQLFRKNIKKSFIMPDSLIPNITTIPDSDFYAQSNETNFGGKEFYETSYEKQHNTSSFTNESMNSINHQQQNNYVKTVKMLKQKDASNKNQKQINKLGLSFDNRSHLFDNPSRYFSNETNEEINEYYDYLNPIGSSSSSKRHSDMF